MSANRRQPFLRSSAPARSALIVAGAYVVVALTYILFSDLALEMVVPADQISRLQTIKGWAFVVVTGVLLYLLVRHRAQMIETRRANLQAVLQASPLPIYTVDESGAVVSWNIAAERILGWSAQEVIGRSDPLRCTWGDEEADARRAALEAGERVVGVELLRANRSGDWRQYLLFAARLHRQRDGGGSHLVILQDVTELRRRQEILQQGRLVSRSLDDFDQAVGVIGHELRTPLASIRANAEVLLSESFPDADAARQLIQTIHDQIRVMTEMSNNMLESARLGSGHARWNWQTVPLEDTCAEAIEIVRPLIDPARVRLVYEVSPAELTMKSDTDAIRRLLLNLITNAVKHTPEGDIRIEIRPLDVDGQRWIEITVRDTGFGMNPEAMRRLGEAFASNEGPINESSVRGAGLGLAICCHIVAAHDGRIAVASKPNAGTRVVARLAADLAEPADVDEVGSIIREIEA